MNIYGLQKLTLLDYPQKTACTLFTGGCNFRCPFCHNSNLVCGQFPEPIDENDLFAFLKKRAGILDGVCITGGEPLINADIKRFIIKIRSLGYLVKLDTNGSNPELLSSLIEEKIIDYVAMDIKNSKEAYSKTIGIKDFDLTPILKSVHILMNSGIDYEFRTTIVKEFHNEENITKIGEWISGAKRYFLQSFSDSENVIEKNLHPVEENQLKYWKDILKRYINFVEIRGI